MIRYVCPAVSVSPPFGEITLTISGIGVGVAVGFGVGVGVLVGAGMLVGEIDGVGVGVFVGLGGVLGGVAANGNQRVGPNAAMRITGRIITKIITPVSAVC